MNRDMELVLEVSILRDGCRIFSRDGDLLSSTKIACPDVSHETRNWKGKGGVHKYVLPQGRVASVKRKESRNDPM